MPYNWSRSYFLAAGVLRADPVKDAGKYAPSIARPNEYAALLMADK
jgi:hypothetical protein